MLSPTLIITTVLSAIRLVGAGPYIWPNHVMDELEHLLVDTGGFNDGRFQKAITPCSNYVNGAQTLGRQTSAQWIRVAFHDFATADVSAKTGGIDASIGFETLRPENSGSAMNDSLSFFAPFVNEHVSMADLIALSVVMSVGTCSSPSITIPLRGGRIDATEGGALGVPEPETNITTTLAQFAQAGFNQQDAIALTACGHTLGSVHNGGFPQVVPPSAVTPNNTGGAVHFDSTVTLFDIDVVNEYLSGTGQRGGPLVTTDNVTVRSDLRIYESDNNATMKSLAKSSDYFISTCTSLLERMINTVPSTSTLTDVIVPNAVKPVNVSLDIYEDAALRFSGFIRVLSNAHMNSSNVTLSWLSRTGQSSSNFTTAAKFDSSQTGTSLFGDTYYYAFNTTVDPGSGISSFKVTIADSDSDGSNTTYSNEGFGYPVEDRAFILKSRSSVDNDGNAVVTAAVIQNSPVTNITAIFSTPAPQNGTLGPKITHVLIPLSKDGDSLALYDYDFFTGSTNLASSGSIIQQNVVETNDLAYVGSQFQGTRETIGFEVVNAFQISADLVTSFEGGEVARDEFRRLKAV